MKKVKPTTAEVYISEQLTNWQPEIEITKIAYTRSSLAKSFIDKQSSPKNKPLEINYLNPIDYEGLSKALSMTIDEIHQHNFKYFYEYDEEEHRNDGYSDSYIKELENKNIIANFVNQQDLFSINENGKVERNNIIKEFKKYCYENNITSDLKNDDIIELVKSEYWKRSESKLNKKEFFESLKPSKFRYRW